MPTRNTRKIYGAKQIYHVYSRGVAKEPIFKDAVDYEWFLELFARYLSEKPAISTSRVAYSWYGDRIELLAYCLMGNHIHLLLYQEDSKAMQEFMHSLMTSYSMYFNKRYSRVGPIFQSRYLANIIDSTSYLEHISRYIHLNPEDWQSYKYSSLQYYLDTQPEVWLKPKLILDIFKDKNDYLLFLNDYKSQRDILHELKYELAHE